MKIFMFIIMFLLIGAFFIISEGNIYLGNSEERVQFFDLYGHWFDGLIDNAGTVSGYVVQMDWLPE